MFLFLDKILMHFNIRLRSIGLFVVIASFTSSYPNHQYAAVLDTTSDESTSYASSNIIRKASMPEVNEMADANVEGSMVSSNVNNPLDLIGMTSSNPSGSIDKSISLLKNSRYPYIVADDSTTDEMLFYYYAICSGKKHLACCGESALNSPYQDKISCVWFRALLDGSLNPWCESSHDKDNFVKCCTNVFKQIDNAGNPGATNTFRPPLSLSPNLNDDKGNGFECENADKSKLEEFREYLEEKIDAQRRREVEERTGARRHRNQAGKEQLINNGVTNFLHGIQDTVGEFMKYGIPAAAPPIFNPGNH